MLGKRGGRLRLRSRRADFLSGLSVSGGGGGGPGPSLQLWTSPLRSGSLSKGQLKCDVSFSSWRRAWGSSHPAADLNSAHLSRCAGPRASQPPSTRRPDYSPGPNQSAKAASGEARGPHAPSVSEEHSRGRGLAGPVRHTHRETPWGRGHVGGGAAAAARGKRLRGLRAEFSASAARDGSVGARLLAQFQKAARDIAAPTEKGPEPWGRLPDRGAARAGDPPRRPDGRAAPPPFPGSGQRRRRRRPDRVPKEPLRPPGQPAAGRRRASQRAVPRPAGGAGPGECLRAWEPRGSRSSWVDSSVK